MVELAGALPSFVALESLDLSYNKIGVAGGKALAASVAVCGSLTSINLRSNEIGKEAALSLVSIFKEKDQMKSVGLAGCDLGADGAKAVADYVSGSAVLTALCALSRAPTQNTPLLCLPRFS